MEAIFTRVLNLFLKSLKIFPYSLLISGCNLVLKRVKGRTRLQEAMLHGGPSFAQRIGRQIYRGSTGEPPKIEDFS